MPTIPADAYFRRAEGIALLASVCEGLEHVEAVAFRVHGETRTRLGRADVRLLTRLSRWSRAQELDVAADRLAALSDRDLVFWSRFRSGRELSGAPLDALEGRVALRDNVHPVPVVPAGFGRFAPFPEMVRRSAPPVTISGAALVTMEWDLDVLTLVVRCCARHHRLVTDLIAALDGRREVASFDAEARAVLALLDDLGLLERYTPPAWDGEARVTWMGHAGVLYEAAGRRVLVDTIAFPRSQPTKLDRRPVDLRTLGDLDCVVATHGDNDHLHPGLLFRVPRTTPVLIPSTPEPRPYQVDMRRILETLGFETIVELDEWQPHAIGPVTIRATPFRGANWGLTLACRSYVIESDALTIYLNADSVPAPEAEERIAREHRIDLAFVGVTGAEEGLIMPPRYGYGDFYAPHLPHERRNEWIKLCGGPQDAADVARRIGARYAFGYAAGGVPFYPTMYCDRGTHAELAACLLGTGGPTRPLALEVGVPARVPPAS